METNNIYVAIDLGSTKITGVLAQKTPEGEINILAREAVEAKFIRRGEIKNASETAMQIKKIVERLNNHKLLQENSLEINSVYVALGGHSLTSSTHNVKRLLAKGSEISQELIKEMYAEAHNLKFGDNEIFGVVEQEYLVDDEMEVNPVGMNCSNLQGRYLVVHGKETLKYNLCNSLKFNLETHGISLINEQLAPIAGSLAAATVEDIEKGCVFIDFGAETTSVCVYLKGCLRHLFVVPFGGNIITKDIVDDLNMTQADAERMKINFGSALAQMAKDCTITIPAENGHEELDISALFVAQVIEARISEMLGLIWNEISSAGLSKYLGAGFIITGGASKLPNLDKLIELKTGCSARYANLDNAVVLGLLKSATKNCVKLKKKPQEEEVEKVQEKNFISKFVKKAKKMKPNLDLGRIIFGELDNEADEKIG